MFKMESAKIEIYSMQTKSQEPSLIAFRSNKNLQDLRGNKYTVSDRVQRIQRKNKILGHSGPSYTKTGNLWWKHVVPTKYFNSNLANISYNVCHKLHCKS